MTEKPGPEPSSRAVSRPRRYGDTEIERILKKAADLQERSHSRLPGEAAGLTLEELRQVARDAGIDPRFIDMAAADAGGPQERRESALAGGPVSWHYQTSIQGEVRDSDKDRILQAIRSVMGQKGEIVEVFGRMEWSYDDGLGPIVIGIVSRDGTTQVDVTATRTGEAGLYAGLGMPLGGVFGGAAIAGIVGISGPAALLPVLAMAVASYGAVRVGWTYRAREWERRLERVIERIASVAQDVAVPALPDGGEAG